MKVHTLPAASGWRWLLDAYAIFRRNPPLLLLLVSFYWLILLLLNLVPVIGPVAASIAIPGLSVGVMKACRDLDEGRLPLPSVLFAGFRDNRQSLIQLGILYLVLTMAIIMFSALVDGGELMRYLTTGKAPDKEDADLLAPVLVMLLLVPLLMAFWFGPMLAAWYRLPALKSLFFSLVACWLNWRAFLAYAVALLLIGVVLPICVLTLATLVLPQEALGFVTLFLSLPLLLVLMPVIFASFYVSYRDVFGVSEHV